MYWELHKGSSSTGTLLIWGSASDQIICTLDYPRGTNEQCANDPTPVDDDDSPPGFGRRLSEPLSTHVEMVAKNIWELDKAVLANITLGYNIERRECEHASVGNGVCDAANMNMECGFDGGDCCRSTCGQWLNWGSDDDGDDGDNDDGDDDGGSGYDDCLTEGDDRDWDSTCYAPLPDPESDDGSAWPFYMSFGDGNDEVQGGGG